MSYLAIAKQAEQQIKEGVPQGSLSISKTEEEFRYQALSTSLKEFNQIYQQMFPQGGRVISWIKKNCPELSQNIEQLETQIDQEILSPVVSLIEYQSLLNQLRQAYEQGFECFNSHYSQGVRI